MKWFKWQYLTALALIVVLGIGLIVFKPFAPKNGDENTMRTSFAIADFYEGEPLEVQDLTYVFQRAEYKELGENAAAAEDVEVRWDDSVVFISDKLAEKILTAESSSQTHVITVVADQSESIYKPGDLLVHVDRQVGYRVENLNNTTYTLVRAEVDEVFDELIIPEQSIILNLDNLAFVSDGVEVSAVGNPAHVFTFLDKKFFDDAVTVNGEIRLYAPCFDIRYKLGTSGNNKYFDIGFQAKQEISLSVTGQVSVDRSQSILIATYGLDLDVVGQAAINLYLDFDVKGTIYFRYEIEQSLDVKSNIRGEKGNVFPKLDTVRFSFVPDSELTLAGSLNGELSLQVGVKVDAVMNIFSHDIAKLDVLCAIQAHAKLTLNTTGNQNACFNLTLDLLLQSRGEVLYIVTKSSWPFFEIKKAEVLIYDNKWPMYELTRCSGDGEDFEVTEHSLDGPPRRQLNISATGGEIVQITSSTGHQGTTSYNVLITYGSTNHQMFNLEAPLYLGSGTSRMRFSHWLIPTTPYGEPQAVYELSISPRLNQLVVNTLNPIPIRVVYVDDPEVFYSLRVNSFIDNLPSGGFSITSTTGHGYRIPDGADGYLRQGIDEGKAVHLEAPEYLGTGSARKRFSHWSGAVSSQDRSITFTMDNDKTLSVHYVSAPEPGRDQPILPPTYTLTVSSNEKSVGIKSKTGHDGITNYTITNIASGTEIILEAPEYIGSGNDRKKFSHWSGAVNTKDRLITLTVSADTVVTAHYSPAPVPQPVTYTLKVNSSEDPFGINITSSTGHGGRTSYTVPDIISGTEVILSAPTTALVGPNVKVFSHWKGDVPPGSEKNPNLVLVITSDMTVTAVYVNQ